MGKVTTRESWGVLAFVRTKSLPVYFGFPLAEQYLTFFSPTDDFYRDYGKLGL